MKLAEVESDSVYKGLFALSTNNGSAFASDDELGNLRVDA